MEPIFELALELPARGSRQRMRDLHQQLRAAIVSGRLQAGMRLPPSRSLATALGVSRNTVVAAYDLLLSEGYLETRPGSGTFIAALPAGGKAEGSASSAAAVPDRLNAVWRNALPMNLPVADMAIEFDFQLGMPDWSFFPFEIWRRLTARAHRMLEKGRTLAGYGDPAGQPALRAAVARHISFARAVACRSGDVQITSGAQQAFDLLARILVTPGETVVAIEDPGYPSARAAFAAAGAKLVPIPVDDEGLVVGQLPPEAKVIYVTPSHQFPLGMAMSKRRRVALLEWARAQNAVIVEDDYDGEFRFGGRPLDALQTLDREGRVFYVGTFSKSLFPALRLGFVIAPAWAQAALLAAKQYSDWHSPLLPQEALAAFIDEGHLARHVRKMRGIYAERRRALLEALDRHCKDGLRPIAGEAGLHLAVRIPEPRDAAVAAASAEKARVRVQPAARFSMHGAAPDSLVLGYGRLPADRMEPAVQRLVSLAATGCQG